MLNTFPQGKQQGKKFPLSPLLFNIEVKMKKQKKPQKHKGI